MNVNSGEDPATQANLAVLRERGVRGYRSRSRPSACGWEGEGGGGRMSEPAGGSPARGAPWLGRAAARRRGVVFVTAGGTLEAIDSVRFVGNRSSGKMGFAVAAAAARRGAAVALVAAGGAADRARRRCTRGSGRVE